jgi:hypothetical protein
MKTMLRTLTVIVVATGLAIGAYSAQAEPREERSSYDPTSGGYIWGAAKIGLGYYVANDSAEKILIAKGILDKNFKPEPKLEVSPQVQEHHVQFNKSKAKYDAALVELKIAFKSGDPVLIRKRQHELEMSGKETAAKREAWVDARKKDHARMAEASQLGKNVSGVGTSPPKAKVIHKVGFGAGLSIVLIGLYDVVTATLDFFTPNQHAQKPTLANTKIAAGGESQDEMPSHFDSESAREFDQNLAKGGILAY